MKVLEDKARHFALTKDFEGSWIETKRRVRKEDEDKLRDPRRDEWCMGRPKKLLGTISSASSLRPPSYLADGCEGYFGSLPFSKIVLLIWISFSASQA